MTWERIETQAIRGGGVTVSWRVPNGRKNPALAISIGRLVAEKARLEKGDRSRVIVERNKMAGKIRLRLAPKDALAHECRHVAWKDKGCTVAVPLEDVKLRERKPAQDALWSVEGEWLVIKLPHWACPLIQVSGAA
jgi:hypothetical protein